MRAASLQAAYLRGAPYLQIARLMLTVEPKFAGVLNLQTARLDSLFANGETGLFVTFSFTKAITEAILLKSLFANCLSASF